MSKRGKNDDEGLHQELGRKKEMRNAKRDEDKETKKKRKSIYKSNTCSSIEGLPPFFMYCRDDHLYGSIV
jgi:protein subunit release factor B